MEISRRDAAEAISGDRIDCVAAPHATLPVTVLASLPFAFAVGLQACAVDHQMDRCVLTDIESLRRSPNCQQGFATTSFVNVTAPGSIYAAMLRESRYKNTCEDRASY